MADQRQDEEQAQGSMDSDASDELARASDALDDAETAPQNPSASLAAVAGHGLTARARRAARIATLREILGLSWPVMLSQLLVTAVALVDIALVGRLGPYAVAAVGYATQFFFMAQSALFAVGFACVALMARAIGAGRRDAAREAFGASLVVGVSTALVVGAAVVIWPVEVLHVLNADPAVIAIAVPYVRMVLGSTLLLAVALVIENALRADRDTVRPMVVAVAVSVVKIALSAALIFGLWGFPRLELVGAGIATLVAQALGVVLLVGIVARAPAASALGLRRSDMVASWRTVAQVVRVAAPGVAERIVLNLALLSYFAMLANYGTVAVAAYTVGVRALSFSWIPGTAFAAAVATLVGQVLGAGDEAGATAIGRRAAGLALGVAIPLGALGAALRTPIAQLFTTDAATVATLGPFLLCLAAAQPMLQLHFTLAGVHRGAGDTWTPLLAAAVGNWCFRVPVAALCAYVFNTDLVWLWLALVVDHLARAVWLGHSFVGGRWRRALAPSPAVGRRVLEPMRQ